MTTQTQDDLAALNKAKGVFAAWEEHLFKRMDEDEEIYFLKDYKMKDDVGKDVEGVINVTLPLPAIFAAHVHAQLMGAIQQPRVFDTQIPDQDSEVEDYLDSYFLGADARLENRDLPTLRAVITEQLNIRGRAAARITTDVVNGVIKPNILPIDTRNLAYESDEDGLKWAAYKTLRTPAEITGLYPGVMTAGVAENYRGLVEVTDFWDREWNWTYVEDRLARPPVAHDYGEVPFVIKTVPMGSMLQTEKAMGKYGESIFFLVRPIIDEYNRAASIEQTINMTSILPANTWHSREGVTAEVPDDVATMGTSTAADIGGGVRVVEQADLTQAGLRVGRALDKLFQIGTMAMTDYGQDGSQPHSAVALVKLAESRNEVFTPRLGAKGLLYEGMGRMVIRQSIAKGLTVIKIGEPEHERSFKVEMLKGRYTLQYEYTIRNPQTDVALIALADQYRRHFGEHRVLDKILHEPHPEKIIAEKLAEDAGALLPAILYRRTAKALLKAGETDPDALFEAELMSEAMGVSTEQMANMTAEEMAKKMPAPGPAMADARTEMGALFGKPRSNADAAKLEGQPSEPIGV